MADGPRAAASGVARFGDAEALVDGDLRLTFAQSPSGVEHLDPAAMAAGVEPGVTGSPSGRRTSGSGSSPPSGRSAPAGACPRQHRASAGGEAGYDARSRARKVLLTVNGFLGFATWACRAAMPGDGGERSPASARPPDPREDRGVSGRAPKAPPRLPRGRRLDPARRRRRPHRRGPPRRPLRHHLHLAPPAAPKGRHGHPPSRPSAPSRRGRRSSAPPRATATLVVMRSSTPSVQDWAGWRRLMRSATTPSPGRVGRGRGAAASRRSASSMLPALLPYMAILGTLTSRMTYRACGLRSPAPPPVPACR